jgi:hypothetical protein
MQSYLMQLVVAPLLITCAVFQLTSAALTQTTYFFGRWNSDTFEVSRSDDPLMFYVALTQAAVFLVWAGWIYWRAGRSDSDNQ